MDPSSFFNKPDADAMKQMLAGAGYSEKAIALYINKPYMGTLDDADAVIEMTGTCGDTMQVFLKAADGRIEDVRYQVLGCPGAVASAMAAVSLVKGRTLDEALALNDGDIFKELVEIPSKKHHCIQLAVKALHKAVKAYKNGNHQEAQGESHATV